MEHGLSLSYKVKYTLIIWLSYSTFRSFPREMKIYVPSKTCAWMFVAAIFAIGQTQKQPECPSPGKYINTPAMDYHSANRIVWITDRHNDMTKSQKHKTVHIIWFHLYGILELAKLTWSVRRQISDCLGSEKEDNWMEGDMREFCGMITMFCIVTEMVVKQVYSCVNTQHTELLIALPGYYTSKLFWREERCGYFGGVETKGVFYFIHNIFLCF